MKFKVGDRVKCIESYDSGKQFTEGKIYEVGGRFHGADTLGVVADDKGNNNGWSYKYFITAIPEINEQKLRKALRLE